MASKKNKWRKYNIMRRYAALRPHVPKTKRWSRVHLRSMLKKYRRVIVKPVNGSGGAGVIRVRALKGRRYEIRYRHHKKKLSGFDSAYKFVRKRKSGTVIVQRHIQLAEVSGRPFDLRVMVQRKSRASRWKITGKLAKVAGRGYIITNVRRSHGSLLPAGTAIRRSNIRGASTSRILRRTDRVSRRCASKLSRHYSWIHTVGMDIGIDRNGKVWIIEANFRPMLSLFKKLKSSRKDYKRIAKYQRRWKRK